MIPNGTHIEDEDAGLFRAQGHDLGQGGVEDVQSTFLPRFPELPPTILAQREGLFLWNTGSPIQFARKLSGGEPLPQ